MNTEIHNSVVLLYCINGQFENIIFKKPTLPTRVTETANLTRNKCNKNCLWVDEENSETYEGTKGWSRLIGKYTIFMYKKTQCNIYASWPHINLQSQAIFSRHLESWFWNSSERWNV